MNQGLAAVRAATRQRVAEERASFVSGLHVIVPDADVADVEWSPLPPRLTDVEFWGALEGALGGLGLGEGWGFQDTLMALLSGGTNEPGLRRHFVETLFATASSEAASEWTLYEHQMNP